MLANVIASIQRWVRKSMGEKREERAQYHLEALRSVVLLAVYNHMAGMRACSRACLVWLINICVTY